MHNNPGHILIAAVLAGFAACASAQNVLLDVNLFYAAPDAGGNDDFHTGKTLWLNGSYFFLPWLAVTGGVLVSEEIREKPASDVVGSYQASVESRAISLGLRPEKAFSERNRVYARAGVLLYSTELVVEEDFGPGVPNGSRSDSTSGYGYFATVGWGHSFTPAVSFQLELGNMTQLGLFEDKSAKPFDLSHTGFSIGLGYAF